MENPKKPLENLLNMPDTTIPIPKLKGSKNWDIWYIRIESILIEKGYYDVCSQPISSVIDSLPAKELEERKQLSFKALAFIRLALEDGPLLQSRNIRDPFELFSYLRNLYKSKGFSSEFLIIKQLLNTTLSNSKDNIELYL